MYIHFVGICYVIYALNLMWVVFQLLHPRLRVINMATIVPFVVIGIGFVDFLLHHNPLAGFRNPILLIVHLFASCSAFALAAKENDTEDEQRFKNVGLLGLMGIVLGIAIAVLQYQTNPPSQLLHW